MELIIPLKLKFDNVAANWAQAIAHEMGGIPAEAIWEAVEKETLPRIVWDVVQACNREGIHKPDVQEKYAASAVASFDKTLKSILDKRDAVAEAVNATHH